MKGFRDTCLTHPPFSAKFCRPSVPQNRRTQATPRHRAVSIGFPSSESICICLMCKQRADNMSFVRICVRIPPELILGSSRDRFRTRRWCRSPSGVLDSLPWKYPSVGLRRRSRTCRCRTHVCWALQRLGLPILMLPTISQTRKRRMGIDVQVQCSSITPFALRSISYRTADGSKAISAERRHSERLLRLSIRG
jgi:hypothetical protein